MADCEHCNGVGPTRTANALNARDRGTGSDMGVNEIKARWKHIDSLCPDDGWDEDSANCIVHAVDDIATLQAELRRLTNERNDALQKAYGADNDRRKSIAERDAAREVCKDLVNAMTMWGLWEDGVPDAENPGDSGIVGRAYDAGKALVDSLGKDGKG